MIVPIRDTLQNGGATYAENKGIGRWDLGL